MNTCIRIPLLALLAFSAAPTLATETPAAPTIYFEPSVWIDPPWLAASHVPVVTGTITSCTSSPNLPIGLTLKNTTCVISGTPRFETALSSYAITASNEGGSATTMVTITIADPDTSRAVMLTPRTYAGSAPRSLRKVDIQGRTVESRSINSAGELADKKAGRKGTSVTLETP